MLSKIKEIGSKFRGHTILFIIWLVVSALVAALLFFLPYLTGELLFAITKSESLYKTLDKVSLYWMLGIMGGGLIYSVVGLKMQLSLFRTIGNIIKGFANIMGGGVLGLLLIIPGLIFFVLKLLYAGFAGYFVIVAGLVSFVMNKTVPTLKNTKMVPKTV